MDTLQSGVSLLPAMSAKRSGFGCTSNEHSRNSEPERLGSNTSSTVVRPADSDEEDGCGGGHFERNLEVNGGGTTDFITY